MRGELLWYLGTINAVTFVTFGLDKRRARAGRRRIRERTLHLLAAAGGSVAALVAMRLLRHKNRKPVFRLGVVAIFVLHVALFAWWLLAGSAGAGR